MLCLTTERSDSNEKPNYRSVEGVLSVLETIDFN